MFADDSKFFKTVRGESDCEQLQSDIESVYDWCKEWRMKANVKKCCQVNFSNKKNIIDYSYSMGGETLKNETCVVNFKSKLQCSY